MRNTFWIGVLSLYLAGCTYNVAPAVDEESSSSATQETESGDVLTSSGALVLEEGAESVVEPTLSTHRERLLQNGVLEIGAEDAPLTLLLFTEYHCKYCKDFTDELLPRLQADFISTDKLKLQIAIRPLEKYQGEEEALAAQICAAQQEKGLAMHTALFGNPSTISEHAATLEIANEQFANCLESTETSQLLSQQIGLVKAEQVDLVPTLIFDGEKHTGLPYYADLRGMVEAALR